MTKKRKFSCYSNEKTVDDFADLGYGKRFHLLTSELLLKLTVFEEMSEFDIFYREPKKCFSPLRLSLLDW